MTLKKKLSSPLASHSARFMQSTSHLLPGHLI